MKLTNQELSMLVQVVTEYIEIFGEAESTRDYTSYMLDNGLGSAMKKLTKGTNSQCIYKDYICHRESFVYPSFEEWKLRWEHEVDSRE